MALFAVDLLVSGPWALGFEVLGVPCGSCVPGVTLQLGFPNHNPGKVRKP